MGTLPRGGGAGPCLCNVVGGSGVGVWAHGNHLVSLPAAGRLPLSGRPRAVGPLDSTVPCPGL